MKKMIKLAALLLLSLFSLLIAAVLVNHFLPVKYSLDNLGYIKYAIDDDIFSRKYIFWKKPYCEKDCNNYLETISSNKVITFGENYGNCEKVLFLGDSFTYAPWWGEGRSYAESFTEKLSQANKSCYILVRLASTATNNDQQFAKLSDVIKKINPKLVIWQFCWNDAVENLDKGLYREDKSGHFKRIGAFGNMYFWSGFIYQNFPFIKNSNLGVLLLYLGERYCDLFFDWNNAFFKNKEIIFSANTDKIKYFLGEVQKMGKDNGFEFVTTLAPLECELGFPTSCAALNDKAADTSRYNGFLEINEFLFDLLTKNSKFVSMYENEDISDSQKLNLVDFRGSETGEEPGLAHLNSSGLEKTGNILFLNFTAAIDQGIIKFK